MLVGFISLESMQRFPLAKNLGSVGSLYSRVGGPSLAWKLQRDILFTRLPSFLHAQVGDLHDHNLVSTAHVQSAVELPSTLDGASAKG